MGRTSLIAEYAYVLRPGGILYTVTDVKGESHLLDVDPQLTGRTARMDGCTSQDSSAFRYHPR